MGKGPGWTRRALHASQAHVATLEPWALFFDSSVDPLLDARPPRVVNEDRALPSGKLKKTVPSGELEDKGWGVAGESKPHGRGSQAQTGGDVGTAVGDFTPVAVRLVRRQTTRPVLRAAGRVSLGVFFVLASCSQRERGKSTCPDLQS